jgi:hypothetical protein
MPDQTPHDPSKEGLDPLRLILGAEENLMGFRQNLILQAWEAAVLAAESAEPADLDKLIRLHAGIQAIDFALAQRPSAYKFTAPI